MIIEKTEDQKNVVAALSISLSGLKGREEFTNIRTELLKDLIDTCNEYLNSDSLPCVSSCFGAGKTEAEKKVDQWVSHEALETWVTSRATEELIGGRFTSDQVGEAISYFDRCVGK